MTLFRQGNFMLHSGSKSHFLIDCSEFSDAAWQAIAAEIIEQGYKFGMVVGIPRGGLKLAEALRPYVTIGPTLIVDDVLTTGRSMEEEAAKLGRMHPYQGIVVFARGKCPAWVTPIFQMWRQ